MQSKPLGGYVGIARAQLVGWTLVALLQVAIVSAFAPAAKGGALARLLFDMGLPLAAGFVTMGLVAGWVRLPEPTRRWMRWVVTAAVGALWAWLMGEDLLGLVSWMPGPVTAYASLLGAAAGAALPWLGALSAHLASKPRQRTSSGNSKPRQRTSSGNSKPRQRTSSGNSSPLRRGAAIALAVVLVAVNGFVLVTGYEGIHLWVLFAAAAVAGGALHGVRLPWALPSRGNWVLDGVLALAAAAALALPPSSGVLAALLSWPGSAFTPFLSRVRGGGGGCGDEGAREAADNPWFKADRPPVPPTSPPLVAGDRIVLLFTIDAVRADVLADDRHAAALPNLVALRNRSVAFDNARATSPATAPSITSIMTGKYYSQIYWSNQKMGRKLKFSPREDGSVGFAKLLADAGVTTLHIATPEGATQDSGIARGFAEEVMLKRSAAEYPAELKKRLEAFRGGRLFVYGHFIEPHHPYKAPGATSFDKYLGEVASVDKALGAIFETVARLGLEDRTVILVSSDHGEAFGEHGTQFHSVSVYDELLRVPLLVRAPGVAPKRVDTPVSIIDIGPTVLDLFEQPTPGQFMGQSLVPLLRGSGPLPTRPIVADSGRRMQAMVFGDGFKVIEDLRHRSVALYDLGRDPKELDDLADRDADRLCKHDGMLRAFFATHTLKRDGYEPPYRP